MGSLVMVFMLVYFIPKFRVLFKGFGAALPVLTQGIMAASEIVTHYGLACLAVIVVLVLGLRRAMASQAGRRHFERFVLKVPALGAVLSRFALVRFCRMLGTLLESGVSLVTALRVAKAALGNQSLSDAVSESIDQVQRGVSLAQSLTNCPQLFPPSITEIIAVAEESGRLGKELVRLANANETELDRRLRTLVTLAEPTMLFIMAALVGTVVIGMLLPVFTLQEYIH
jgi:type II secretory pathway component PulF